MEEKKWLLNTKNNSVWPWSASLEAKRGMIPCDAQGRDLKRIEVFKAAQAVEPEPDEIPEAVDDEPKKRGRKPKAAKE